jgi:hypothetical protein
MKMPSPTPSGNGEMGIESNQLRRIWSLINMKKQGKHPMDRSCWDAFWRTLRAEAMDKDRDRMHFGEEITLNLQCDSWGTYVSNYPTGSIRIACDRVKRIGKGAGVKVWFQYEGIAWQGVSKNGIVCLCRPVK